MYLLLCLLASADPDVPAPAQDARTYAAPGGNISLSDAEIALRVIQSPQDDHLIWQPGWVQWKKWWESPELARAVFRIAGDTPIWSATDGKEKTQTTAGALAAAIKAGTPAGLAWKEGMTEWVVAGELPEIALLLAWPRLPEGKSAPHTSSRPPIPAAPAKE